MPGDTRRDARRGDAELTWFPGRGFAGGAVTGVWFAVVIATLSGAVEVVGAGWSLRVATVAGVELLQSLVVVVPVFTLVGGTVPRASRTSAIGAYAAAALVGRLLFGPALDEAVGAPPVTGPQMAGLGALSVLAAVLAALVSTRERLPRTSGRVRVRAGSAVARPAPHAPAAPAPAGRSLSGGA